ncbi:SDR family oxidoreductase [Succinimonas sp.]|uniref:SDR family oxidoreductase n=1 Tax=Succinimonas sp. TaxID=1936151 RepID=UPI00386E0406
MSRNYLILGASSDVGIELIKEINNNEETSTIWAHYCSNSKLIRSIAERNGNSIIPIAANFSDLNDVKKLCLKINDSQRLPLSIVHLPAPKLLYVKFKELDWEDCISDVNIQVRSIFQLLQFFLPRISKMDQRAKIVFMLSENTINPPAKFTTKYTMSKYMLLGLMKSLVVEYAGKNVNINALSPSMIDTKLLSEIDRRMLDFCGALDNILAPQDVALSLWKLLSVHSDNMNGENVLFSGTSNEI